MAAKKLKKAKKKAAPEGYKPGAWLEQVVAIIESQLLQVPDARLESPKKLKDKDTGRWRQHDVVITHRISHHTPHVIAIECKDRSRPIDVDKVEAFRSKCKATRVHQGAMVSAKGFTEAAKLKANAYDIKLLDIHGVEQLDWVASTEFPIVGRHILHNNVMFGLDGDRLAEICQPIQLFHEDGRPVSGDDVMALAQDKLAEYPIHEEFQFAPDTTVERRMPFTLPEKVFAVDANGSDFEVSENVLVCRFKVIRMSAPMFLYKYVTSDGQDPVSTAAIASFDLGDTSLILSMAGPDDGEKHIQIRFKDQTPDDVVKIRK